MNKEQSNEEVSPKSLFYPYSNRNSDKLSLPSGSISRHFDRSRMKLPISKVKHNQVPLIKLEEVQPEKEFTPRNDPRAPSSRKNQGFSGFINVSPRFQNPEEVKEKSLGARISDNTPQSLKNKNVVLMNICNNLLIPKVRRQRKSISEVQEKSGTKTLQQEKIEEFRFFAESSETISSDSSELDFRFPGGINQKGDSPAKSNNPALQRLRKNGDSMGSQGESALSRNNVSIVYTGAGDVTTFYDNTPIIEGFKIVRQIGQGSFAKVYKAREEDSLKEYVRIQFLKGFLGD